MNPLCHRLCTMRQALDDPEIFGSILPGESWAAWRVVLVASQGEALNDDERLIYRELTGREREPDEPVDELWGIVGRRGGKTRAFAVLGAYLAALIDYSAVQAPGERIKLPLMAPTQKQATKAFSYLLGIFQNVEMLAGMVDGEPTADTIRLKAGVDIEVVPANYRTVRSETLCGALCDEVAFWHLEGSANADKDILDAIRPGLATTGGPLGVLSSPHARRGELHNTYRRDFGAAGDPLILVLQAPSLRMNATLPAKVVERAYKNDPAVAAAEYGAEFRKDVEAFISIEAVQACMAGDLTERPPSRAMTYKAFVDCSGGGADSMTLGIAHREGEIAMLDAVRERMAGGSPDAVVEEFAALLKVYGIGVVTGDKYAGEWPRERFRVHGIRYEVSEHSKTDIYRDFLPILNSQRVSLLAVPKLESQLVSLERRTTRGTGRDVIDHPVGKNWHDDVANAACGATVLCLSGSQPLVVTAEQAAAFGKPKPWAHAKRLPF